MHGLLHSTLQVSSLRAVPGLHVSEDGETVWRSRPLPDVCCAVYCMLCAVYCTLHAATMQRCNAVIAGILGCWNAAWLHAACCLLSAVHSISSIMEGPSGACARCHTDDSGTLWQGPSSQPSATRQPQSGQGKASTHACARTRTLGRTPTAGRAERTGYLDAPGPSLVD